MSFRPGTVSKILWHFTGGPQWDIQINKQLAQLKPAASAYEALKSIVSSGELRVGNYREVVKVIIPQKRRFNTSSKEVEHLVNFPVVVESSPVCCVADIPLQHLAYHANRYGKIAIGFHREAIVRAGFNPVMYTLEDTALLNSIYQGYSAIDEIDPFEAQSELDSFESEVEDILITNEIDEKADSFSVSAALENLGDGRDQIGKSYADFLAYIKTFNENEFDTIYCEREWRSTSTFKFSIEDIAIIILPKGGDDFDFYHHFLEGMHLPRSVTVAAWEDLIEH
ncbi:hypothetical protein HYN46_01795 [Aquirhabdus parva]|uniref:Uncharacterized protein n=2 Tax=Aquirhabdus parva TaxID=2283318 RepID=A0A345P373_9GAMM|nr:hypothetical protein HYN46_01795 [Aquirhabdus parva]